MRVFVVLLGKFHLKLSCSILKLQFVICNVKFSKVVKSQLFDLLRQYILHYNLNAKLRVDYLSERQKYNTKNVTKYFTVAPSSVESIKTTEQGKISCLKCTARNFCLALSNVLVQPWKHCSQCLIIMYLVQLLLANFQTTFLLQPCNKMSLECKAFCKWYKS